MDNHKNLDREKTQALCIGNGQLHDAMTPSVEVSKTLNCINDPMKVLVYNSETYRKTGHPRNKDEGQGWEKTNINDTLNVYDNSENRTPTLIVQKTVFENHSQDTRYKEMGDVCPTISASYGMGGNNQPFVVEEYMDKNMDKNMNKKCIAYRGDSITSPINASNPQLGDACHTLTDDSRNYLVEENMKNKNPILLENNQNHATITQDGISTTLTASMGIGGGYVPMITDEKQKPIGLNRERCGAMAMEDKMSTIQAAAEEDENNQPMVYNAIVRRLTPMECERLQGFPDHWTDIGDWIDSKGKKRKGEYDSPRYTALGNSIALPYWQWMANRMVTVLKNDGVENPTMASLFDGIGGFPLVYLRNGCEPVWASEIEEFPIAVTTKHFGDEAKGIVGDIDNMSIELNKDYFNNTEQKINNQNTISHSTKYYSSTKIGKLFDIINKNN